MSINSCRSDKKVVVVNFQNFRLRSLARSYARILVEYGVETASLWSMDRLTSKIEQKQFTKFVEQEMR